MPIISVPIIGSITYFNNGEGDGLYVLILGIISAFLVAIRLYRGLWVTALIALTILIFDFLITINNLSEMTRKVERDLATNPFQGLGKMMAASVQIQWGWVVLAAGVICLLVSAAMRNRGYARH